METKYFLNPVLVINKSKKNITIFNGEKSTLIELNETASLILKLILKGKNQEDAIKIFAKKFKIDYLSAKEDFKTFFEKLRRKKALITEAEYKKIVREINFQI